MKIKCPSIYLCKNAVESLFKGVGYQHLDYPEGVRDINLYEANEMIYDGPDQQYDPEVEFFGESLDKGARDSYPPADVPSGDTPAEPAVLENLDPDVQFFGEKLEEMVKR